MPHLNNTASCHFRVSMHQYNYSKIFVSIRGSPSPTGRAHARHPRTTFSSLFPMKNYSCPFVVHSWFIFFPSFRAFRAFRAFRGSYSFRHFVPFVLSVVQIFFRVHSCAFVVHILSIPSWFIFSPSLRVHSWPRRTTSAIKKQTGHPRKIIKKVYISTCYSRTSFPYGTSWSP